MHRTTKLLTGAAVGLLALGLTACGSVNPEPASNNSDTAPAASGELAWTAPEGLSGSVTIYAANPAGLNNQLAEAFTAATGVDVEIYGDTTGKITARLDAEWENPQADIVYLASWAPAAQYAADGRVLDYSPANVDSVIADWQGDGFTGRDGSALTLVVNTNTAPETPGDWADLTDPKFQNQVLMPDPRESGTAADLIAAMVSSWGKDATWELFDQLFANGLAVQGANGPALDDVIAGSHAVVMGGVDYSAYSAVQSGEAIEVVLPSSGTTVSPRPVFILEGSKNPEAAQAFVDFMFSAEGQTLSAANNMIPSQPSVPVKDGNVPFDQITFLDYSLDEIAETGPALVDEFATRYLA